MKNRINLYSAVGMKCCHIAYHENHEGIFLVCGRQLTQWRGDDGKPLCKTCKRAARKPETPARRSNADFRRGDLKASNNPQSESPSPARTGSE